MANQKDVIEIGVANPDPPQYGGTVNFDITTDERAPFVRLTCTQDGHKVMEGSAAYFEGGLGGRDFSLNSGLWQGGAAHAVAELLRSQKSGGWHTLATTEFEVVA